MTTECEKILLEIIEQHKTIIEILGEGNTPPEDPTGNAPIYSRGTGSRNVQMIVTTRTRIPFVKDGEIKYNPAGHMRLAKPITNMRVKSGLIYKVWTPYYQVDGTRAYELYDYPGQFLIERQISRL